jgi:predicted nuclease with TOPRIM domain
VTRTYGRKKTTLREQLELRLEELKREFETGQVRLRELEAQAAQLRETMLRISGAIQVLEETLAATEGGDGRESAAPAGARGE